MGAMVGRPRWRDDGGMVRGARDAGRSDGDYKAAFPELSSRTFPSPSPVLAFTYTLPDIRAPRHPTDTQARTQAAPQAPQARKAQQVRCAAERRRSIGSLALAQGKELCMSRGVRVPYHSAACARTVYILEHPCTRQDCRLDCNDMHRVNDNVHGPNVGATIRRTT